MEQTNIVRAATRGVGYLGLTTIIVNFIRMIALAVLARKLGGFDFGIASLAIVIVRFPQESAAFGLETTVIQKKDLSARDINEMFWGSLLFSTAVWLIFILASPLISSLMHIPELRLASIGISIIILITSLGMVSRALLERELKFSQIAFFEGLGQAISFIFAVILVLIGFGYWSLVIGFILGELIKTIYYWKASELGNHISHMVFRGGHAWKFGSFVTADRILTYFSLNIDRILIGRLLGAVAVGYYSLAYELVAFPAKRFSMLVARVLFPALSRIRENDQKPIDLFLKGVKYSAIITMPMLIGLAILAPEASLILFGSKSTIIHPLIRLLCLSGIVFGILTPGGSLFYSLGRPDISAKWSAATFCSISLATLFGASLGLNWTAGVISLTWAILFLVMQLIIAKVSELSYRKVFAALETPLKVSVVVGGVTYIIKFVGSNIWKMDYILCLAISTLFGSLAFIIYVLIHEKKEIFAKMLKTNRTISR